MAQQKQPKAAKELTVPSEPQSSAVATLSSEELAELQKDAGKGLESVRTEDLALPFLTILQALSPQVQKKGGEYVEGAEPGLIFNTVTNALYDKVLVVPATYKTRYTEWKPRDSGGGLVRDWGEDSSMHDKCPRDDRNRVVTPTGTHIVKSSTFFGLLYPSQERVIIAFSSTQLKKGRGWLTMSHNDKIDDGKGGRFTPPLFYRVYELSTVAESNQKGEWFGWRIAPKEPVVKLSGGRSMYVEARALSVDVAAKKVTVKVEQLGSAAQEDDEVPF